MIQSKCGVSNTYQRGDLNALQYDRMLQYPLTSKYIKNLIDLRNDFYAFDQKKIDDEYLKCFYSKEKNSSSAILINANKNENILFVINPHQYPASFEIDINNFNKFVQIADVFSFGDNIAQYQYSNGILIMPSLCCGIWKNY